MKIAYLANSTIPSKSANSIHVMKMCQAFAKNGHEVNLFVPDHSNKLPTNEIYKFYGVKKCFKVNYVSYLNCKGRAFWAGISMAKKVSEFNPDFVLGRILTGCFFVAKKGFTTFFEAHQPVKYSGKIYEYLFKYSVKKGYFENLVVITRALKDYFVRETKICENQVITAPDAADTLIDEKVIKKKLGKSSVFKVGYVGQMYPGKGMEIISALAKECPDYEFHLVGGKGEDLKYWKKELQDLENVYFYGFIPHAETASYMVSVDVLVAPYLRRIESFGSSNSNLAEWTSPLKLFEYMSTQKPIISSDLPVLKEVLVHNKNALLCSPDNIDDWENALRQLEKDKELPERLAAQAYSDFINHYTWKSRIEHILSYL